MITLSSNFLQNSTGITVSAPLGTGAPVIISIAICFFNLISGVVPAATAPPLKIKVIGSFGDAPLVSFDLTANPSIAELSNGGIFSSEKTSLATTNPKISDM